jgi:hypothetical protein
MRSSDPTCCASMAVNTYIFSPGATISKIWPPGAPKLGAELIFMSSLGRSPHWDSIVIRTPPISSSKMSKTSKIKTNSLYIRYNSKIRYIKKVKNRFSLDWVCYGQFAPFGNGNACLLPVIHALYYASSIFYQLKFKNYR